MKRAFPNDNLACAVMRVAAQHNSQVLNTPSVQYSFSDQLMENKKESERERDRNIRREETARDFKRDKRVAH